MAHSAWATTADPIELLTTLFPDTDVSMSVVEDDRGEVYGWSTSIELPLIRARSTSKDRLSVDGRPLVGYCTRIARLSHLGVALRAAKLFDGTPLVVTTDCAEDVHNAAKLNNILLIVV